MPFQQYNVYDGLTACRVVATTNQSGTYFNGQLNNGIGASFSYATGVLTIDGVVIVQGDSVALVGQTNGNENGIYICSVTGAVGVSAVLVRRQDMQCIEQLKVGQWTSVGAGSVSAGSMFVFIEPLPQRFGIDSLFLNPMIPAGLGTASTVGVTDIAQPMVSSVVGATILNDILVAADTSGSLKDSNNIPLSHSNTTSSATPGTIRSLASVQHGTNATMTSGNLVGVRGELDVVGASGGFFYGVQGKIIPTGTLSGSNWSACVFGQFDISAATINAGQTACLWGDYGTSSGTISDASGMRGVAMTNTTAAVLNAQDYRYGNASYLLELAGAGGTLNYYLAAGTGAGSAGNATHCAAQQVIKVEINGVDAFIPVFTQNT